MTTLAIMKTRIANELARDDLTTEIADAITTAISHYQYKRWWFNEDTDVTSATVVDGEYVSSPAPFFDIDAVRCTDGVTTWDVYDASWYDLEARSNVASEPGRPIYRAEYQDQFRLWPIPDAIYTLTWSGIIDRAPASDAETANPWMTKAEALIRARAKAVVMNDVVKHPMWAQEKAQLAMTGSDCLALMEQSALAALNRHNTRKTTTGRIRASNY